MKKLLPLALFLSGCASMQYAGTASYSIRPFVDPVSNKQLCCAVDVRNGKEIGSLSARLVKSGDDYTLELNEQGVTAFKGQAIAAGALTDSAATLIKPLTPAGMFGLPGIILEGR